MTTADGDPSGGRVYSLLEVRDAVGQFAMVCGDRWNQNHSNAVCAKLGYAESLSWSQIYLKQPDRMFFKINEMSNNAANVLSNLNVTDSCEDGVVALECQKYSKSLVRMEESVEWTNRANFF